MRSGLVIKGDVCPDRLSCLTYTGVGLEVDFVVLDGPPEALDKHVVPPSPFTTHGNLDVFPFQHIGEVVFPPFLEEFWRRVTLPVSVCRQV